MNNYLTHLDINYDKNKLLSEMENVDFATWKDSKSDLELPVKLGHVNNLYLPEVIKIREILSRKLQTNEIRPRYYNTPVNYELPMHLDRGTKCCVNIILSENPAPIVFEDIGEIYYECALLNVQERHMVPARNSERILLKFSIFDIDYHTALENWNK